MTPSSYTNLIHNPTASSVQHKRNRLAEKAKTNNGKDTLQISQELHVKKPRESPGKTVTKSQDVDFFVQHFWEAHQRGKKMEAIMALIEVGTKQQKNKSDKEAAVGEAMLMALAQAECE